MERCDSGKPLADAASWKLYVELVTEVMQRERVIGKLKSEETRAAQAYLLRNSTVDGVSAPPKLNDTSCPLGNQAETRDRFRQHQLAFMKQSNLSSSAYDYCSRCLVYLTDFCAKKKVHQPSLRAWSKVREIGLVPSENALSTFLFVFSLPLDDTTTSHSNSDDERTNLDNVAEQRKACLEVATLRDLLYQPSENTVALRVKSLIADGDAVGAERILALLGDKKVDPDNIARKDGRVSIASSSLWKRLRTYAPILQYYCGSGDLISALRVYREMQQSDGVYLNSETYAVLVSALASHGWFQPSSARASCVNLLKPYGFSASSGPALMDELFSEMSLDLLEIDELSANVIIQGFTASFESPSVDTESRVFIGRVTVDNTTALCPETGAKLRLFTLSDDQRKNVRDTLLEMAATQHEEHSDRLLARRNGSKPINRTSVAESSWNGQFAVDELCKFQNWLRLRSGESFTAIIDGPNVAYYGHGDVHWSQVELLLDKLEQMGETALVVMPQKYVASKFWLSSVGYTQELSERELAIMNKLLDSKKLYVVPSSCLDDYYWMISSVSEQKSSERLHVNSEDGSGRFPGLRPIIVTNDQMRDHRLSLLEPRLFRRWTSCHIVNYDIRSYAADEWEERHVTLFPSDFFSREIQGNKAHRFDGNVTAWHFPVGEWKETDRLCISIKH